MAVTTKTRVVWFGMFLILSLSGVRLAAQDLSDMFTNRALITDASFVEIATNDKATVEPGEPLHAGKVGGHSVWISWQAPDDGLVTVTTDGSSFDTLLGVYVFGDDDGDGQTISQLHAIAENDDHDLMLTSFAQFGAVSNHIYQIAVDGFSGATGQIVLSLDFLGSTNLLPQVSGLSGDQSLRLGDPLILTVNVIPAKDMEIEWYLNGAPVSDDYYNGTTLVIPSIRQSDLGLYTARLSVNDTEFFSAPVEIEVNSEGQPSALARNKLPDAALSGLDTGGGGASAVVPVATHTPVKLGATPQGTSAGVVAGYNGTQIFNTTYATVDPTEPPICGVQGGASYWFSYQAPAAGTMTINTAGSSFDTLLGIFTYNGTLTSYTNLITVTCDNNSGANGKTSWVQFTTEAGRNYFIVVDGVNGARGVAYLNYTLNAGQAQTKPWVTIPPRSSLTVATQTPVSLSVTANGTAPFNYQWRQNGAKLVRQTNASLLLANPQKQTSGSYTVVIANGAGSVTSSPAVVAVLNAPLTTFKNGANVQISAFPGARGYQYAVDQTVSLLSSPWARWTNCFPDYGGVIWLTNSTTAHGAEFVRVHSP